MNWKTLKEELNNLKQPAYREKQIRQAFFRDYLESWDDVTVLPKDLRVKLQEKIKWNNIEADKVLEDKKNGSIKARLILEDGEKIEAVLIKHNDGRRTVCVSSQVGCPLGCAFCATGAGGFKRDLSKEEIVEQVVFFARLLKKTEERVSNIVFMGMGEPFLNYDNVLGAIKIFNDNEYLNIGARSISISTIGIVPGIKQLAKENLQVNLAFSLHAPNDKIRDKIIPMNQKYNLKHIFSVIEMYILKTNRRVMLEYLLIDGVNDRPQEAKELVKILKTMPLCYINLIPYNETGKFKASSRENIDKFAKILKDNNIRHTIRREFGSSIKAACGQLARK